MPTSSRTNTKWRPGNVYTCQKCGQEKDYEDFHVASAASNPRRQTRRRVCKVCRNAQMAEYMRVRRMPQAACYFCDQPAVFLTYCSTHWQQHRKELLSSHPDFAYYYGIVELVADYFSVPSTVILFGTSHRQPMMHMRVVAMLVLRHLTNLTCEKLAILFSKNVSNAVRGLQRGEKFYALYEEFREDVDGVIKHVRARVGE